MTRMVLSLGSNLGDRIAHLQSVVDGLGQAVQAVSPVYETDPWGGVVQEPFLNVVLVADDPDYDVQAWLRRAQEFERAAERVRAQRWGPRTLDVDLIAGFDEAGAVLVADDDLTLPHPRAHQRAFVLVPWLDVDPHAELTVDGRSRSVPDLLAELDPAERTGVRRFSRGLTTRTRR
ncbi:2-amino-4-hydroxy-6-hydroxymethyldihydropteridine diphosphokinase [Mycobacterium sp. 1423905.2]|uniref:2-amino-4-hydroxy-6- hydroxymethyldihydropteridine diphosphokinase n=1 Tax=Mycobacterium sp. 1423905.2 TaxID=1856859 RepID=UPI0007FF812C|nr:2-amino-4-hydroxy-6-hydroxymethyldihydropteridine diphosphokinase [Mycobacterium sp. 1423905.2]OBJ47224.1 2-amino-4-hydroxy-6-hydroxymethyldihydropteridine diphosphokinase [Mycobacterium sp. 1423905.2]